MISISKFIFNIITLIKIYNFNKNIFKEKKISSNKKILCEFSGNKSNQVSFSYLVNFLRNKHGCSCIGYIDAIDLNYFLKIKIFLQKNFNYLNYLIYKSFQIDDFILISDNKAINKFTEKEIKKILPKLKYKTDLLKLRIKKVLIGDLIYDSYLKDHKISTIDLKSKNFIKFLKNNIKRFYYWDIFFKNNNVLHIIVSDTVYKGSIILRIAAFKKIISYQCNWDNIYKIDQSNISAYGKFKYYKEEFAKLSKNQKSLALQVAKKRIEKRFKGIIGLDDMIYRNKTSFHSNYLNKNVLLRNKNTKILIASHCFLDAPHVYGPQHTIFPDFYEWLSYLYKISRETNYEWYIKPHPDSYSDSDLILMDFLKNKPEFNIIPKDTSHIQIVKEGIDCVLSVYGTVGWEYAYFKVPVINATKNNPHTLFDFNLHAKDLKDYKNMILNFKKLKINFDKKNIYLFYFMHNLFTRSDWMFESYEDVIKKINGYGNLSTFDFYDYWINNFNIKKYNYINLKIDNFLSSNENYMKNYNLIKNNNSMKALYI
jgi:hypothetical protein